MFYPNRDIEEICYNNDHIKEVFSQIRTNFTSYFKQFLETEAGYRITGKELAKIVEELGVTVTDDSSKADNKEDSFKRIINEAIEKFEKDRQSYLDILDLEALDEYEDDPPNFKNSVLRNSCPIIRLTLQNKKAKELDKYRAEFNIADPGDLLLVVRNLTVFAIDYLKHFYNEETYDNFTLYDQMGLSDLNGEDYIVYGVIGGGIKSHFLYKLYPSVFPNRSRESIWALWYLTDKKAFNCRQDSEFLMIDLDKITTQQNYFYPYDLFAFYAYNIYLLLKKEAEERDIKLDNNYRYVLVNSFLSFIAGLYSEEIDLLRINISEDGYGY